jgi:hypothetical protein
MDKAQRQDGLHHTTRNPHTEPIPSAAIEPLSPRETALLANFRLADAATRMQVVQLLQSAGSEP